MSKSLKKAGIQPGRPNPQRSSGQDGYERRGGYSSIELENFRGFQHLELNDLGHINLLFGPNNSGKTTILEAIYTHASGLNFQPFFSQVVIRRQEQILSGALDMGDKIRSLFFRSGTIPYQYKIVAQLEDDKRKIELNAIFKPSAQLSDLDPITFGQFSGSTLAARSSTAPTQTRSWEVGLGGVRTKGAELPAVFIGQWVALMLARQKDWDITFPFPYSTISSELPFKLAAFHDILAHRQPDADLRVYGSLKRYGLLADFVQAMGATFPDVKDVDMIPYPDGTQGPIYVRTKDGRVLPLYAFGDGMRRWFYLLGNMTAYRNAVHCIEEIDSMMHPASQSQFCRWLAEYADKFENQLFLTSHNIEFADAFLEALYGEGAPYESSQTDSVRLITIRTNQGRPEVWTLRGRDAFEKRKKFELELRG